MLLVARSRTANTHARRWFAAPAATPKYLFRDLTQLDEDALLHAEVRAYASLPPTPMSVQQILSIKDPQVFANFIHREMPIRFAERIYNIEKIKDWQSIPQLNSVHQLHLEAFQEFRNVSRTNLDEFDHVVQRAVHGQREVVPMLAQGMQELRKQQGEQVTRLVNEFLDEFLLNRIGANVLMQQYLACEQRERAELEQPETGNIGIIDEDCYPELLCQESAMDVLGVCERLTGMRPTILIEAHSAALADMEPGKEDGSPHFPFIPGFLQYILKELLKNSCRASVETARGSHETLRARPIHVVVCADDDSVAIRISDRARGIPFNVGNRVWSYLYSTAHKGGATANALAGFGVGLPISRLYARYLGGSLDLVSLPGYGTDAFLFLPRLESQQIERVPDLHGSCHVFSSLSDHFI